MECEIFTGVGIQKFTYPKSIFGSGGSKDINLDAGLLYANPGQTTGELSFEFRASLYFNGPGSGSLDGSRTFSLTGVHFEDGTTPEDHGFDMVFASGRLSPNIAASLGDFNRDGLLNAADVPAMLSALTDLNQYKNTNSLTDVLLAIGDLDSSGVLTNADLSKLLGVLQIGTGGLVAGVPEPNSGTLLFCARQ